MKHSFLTLSISFFIILDVLYSFIFLFFLDFSLQTLLFICVIPIRILMSYMVVMERPFRQSCKQSGRCQKINSFLFEISVCWSCTEKRTIKIERAFSVILRASPATRHNFQLSLQHTFDSIHNWQLQLQDGIFQALPLLTVSLIRRLYVDINVY